MIQLLTYQSGFGQFSLSPFCTKAAWLLTLSGQDWTRRDLSDPRKMPYAKLPAIQISGKTIADSENIRTYLEDQGADFDPGLDAIQRAHARALIRMAEEHMYFHIVLDRWGNDAVWPTIRAIYFADMPRLLRKVVPNRLRAAVISGLRTQGLARFTPAERMHRLEPDLQTIKTLLGQTQYLLADHVTAADLSVAAMLAAMRSTPVETALTRRISGDPVLCDYIDRVQSTVETP